ncbi:unnamed protein product [Cuscuta campestris]|uniref:Ubiquitin-like protease family profile domain-containing protein n=1 Tax=Cuscuta campestris TaxID=132261 RepID=A0A484KNB3_9ASTE|nr:unnamed protein product [Cuscuta campestris]
MASMKVTMASKKGDSEDSDFVTRESDDMLLTMPNGLVYKRLCKPNLLDTKPEAKINSYCNVGNGVKKLKEVLSKDELSEFRKTAFGYWYPWGEDVWKDLVENVRKCCCIMNTSKKPRFNFPGFHFALQIWVYETFPALMQEKECILDEGKKTSWPRALRWSADGRTTKELLEKKIFKNEKFEWTEMVKSDEEKLILKKARNCLSLRILNMTMPETAVTAHKKEGQNLEQDKTGDCVKEKGEDMDIDWMNGLLTEANTDHNCQVMEDGLEEGQKMESVIDNVETASQAARAAEDLDPAIWDISPYSEQPKVAEGIISYLFPTEQPHLLNDVPTEQPQVLTDIPTKPPQKINDIPNEPPQMPNDDPSDGIDVEPQLNVGQLEDIQDEQVEGPDAEEQHTKDIAIDQPEDTTRQKRVVKCPDKFTHSDKKLKTRKAKSRQGPQTSKQKATDGGDDNSQLNNVEAEAGMAESHPEGLKLALTAENVELFLAQVTDSLFVSLLKKEYDNYLGKRKTIAEAALNTSILKPIVGAVPELGGRWVECDYIYMPINTGNHWILAVLDISKKCIGLYDSNSKGKTSRHTKPYLPCLQILLPKVMDKLEVYKERKMPEMGDDVLGIVNVNDCPQQQDAVSCGIFVVKMAEHLIMGMEVDEMDVAGIESFRKKFATKVLLYANRRADQEGRALAWEM